jgi:hypothetical protein
MSTTTSQLDALTPSGTNPLGAPIYTLAGLEWQSSRHMTGCLTHYRGDESLELLLFPRDIWTWKWHKKLAENVWVTVHGEHTTLAEAAAAAAAFVPTVVFVCHMGQLTTWYEITPMKHWVAAIGGDEASVRLSHDGNSYRWQRDYDAAPALFDLFQAHAMEGQAATLTEAMAACIDAPTRLMLAVSALAASYTPADGGAA